MKHQRRITTVVVLVTGIAGALFVGRAFANGVPTTGALTYAGVLEDVNGAPLAGNKNIHLQLWDVATGGTTPHCASQPAGQTLVGGRFHVALPDACTSAVKAGPNRWLEVIVDGTSLGRTKLGAVPYAIEAGNVPVVTEWSSYTPVLKADSTTIANATVQATWRRVGDTAEIHIETGFLVAPKDTSNAAVTSGVLTWSAPPGVVLDNAKSARHDLGSASVIWGNNMTPCVASMTTSLASIYGHCDTNGTPPSTGLGAAMQVGWPGVLTARYIRLNVRVPVKGWKVQ